MKNKIILAVLGMLMVIPLVLASGNNNSEITLMRVPAEVVKIKTVCINGYVFVVAAGGNGSWDSGVGISVVQVMQTVKPHLPPQPISCQ